MPVQLRKLTPEEAALHFPKRGQMDLSEYKAALKDLRPGDAAEIDCGSLSGRALKRRVGQAAKQLGYTLRWSRESSGNLMRFKVLDPQSSKPANGRRTRRRNNPG